MTKVEASASRGKFCTGFCSKLNAGDKNIMSYGDRLRRWAVFRLLENMQRVTIVRCVNKSDADGCNPVECQR
jgi:hypothetical protein